MIKTNTSKLFYNDNEKIWYGERAKLIYDFNDSIGKVVLESLLKRPEHVGQISYRDGKEYTNFEIAKLSICFAKYFEKLGLKQGDVICLACNNFSNVLMAPIFFGAMFRGLCVNPIGGFGYAGTKLTIGMTKPRIIFCDGNSLEMIKESLEENNLNETKVFTIMNHVEGVNRIDELLSENVNVNEFKVPTLKEGSKQLAAILTTSGTTGLPKAVKFSHHQLLNAIQTNFQPTDRFLAFDDFSWIAILSYTIHGIIHGFTNIIAEKKFSPEIFFDIVNRYKVKIYLGTPSHMMEMLQSPNIQTANLTYLKLFISNGAPMPYKVVKEFKKFAGDTEMLIRYGITEMGGVLAIGRGEPDNALTLYNLNTAFKILNENGQFVGPGEIGEICVRYPCGFWEYLNNSQETELKKAGDDFMYTGDLGYFDVDGRLHIVDRKCNILSFMSSDNCYYVSPISIENVINELQQISDSCVVGIDNALTSFLLTAAVVLKPNATLTESEICQHVVDKMEDHEHLRGGVVFVDELPKTSSGKMLRRKVKEIVTNMKK